MNAYLWEWEWVPAGVRTPRGAYCARVLCCPYCKLREWVLCTGHAAQVVCISACMSLARRAGAVSSSIVTCHAHTHRVLDVRTLTLAIGRESPIVVKNARELLQDMSIPQRPRPTGPGTRKSDNPLSYTYKAGAGRRTRPRFLSISFSIKGLPTQVASIPHKRRDIL